MMGDEIKRLYYYNKQYLGYKDFEDEQRYHLDMRRRHNIAHHSWGIVVGLELKRKETFKESGIFETFIEPGMAVDGYGREIIVFDRIKITEADLADRHLQHDVHPVSLAYRREKSAPPKEGYDICAPGNRYTRWQETFTLIIGPASELPGQEPQPHEPVSDDPEDKPWPVYLGRISWGPDPNDASRIIIAPVDAGGSEDSIKRQYIGNITSEVMSPCRELLIRERNAPHPLSSNDEGVAVTLEGSLQVDRKLTAKNDVHIDGTLTLGPSGNELFRGDDPGTKNPITGEPNNGLLIQSAQTVEVNIDSNDTPSDMFAVTKGSTREELFRIQEDGNVGIGTTSPTGKLQINGSAANAIIKFGGSGGDVHHISSKRDIVFNTSNSGTSPAFVFRRTNFDNLSDYTDLLWVLGNGNVGIGTTSPTGKLQINGSAANAIIKFGGSGGDVHHISSKRDIVFNTSNSGTSPAFVFRRTNFDNLSNYTDLLWVLGNGNVGIGTTEPKVKLQVKGGTDANLGGGGYLIIGSTTSNNLVMDNNEIMARNNGANSTLHLQANGGSLRVHHHQTESQKFIITETGNVGIGTTNPGKKLDVNGDIQTGNIYLNGLDINCENTLYLNWFSGKDVTISKDLTVLGDLTVWGGKSGYVTDRFINKSGDIVEQGDVIVLGRSPGEVCYGSDDNIPVPEVDLSTTVYDHRICGIVAELLVEKPTPRLEMRTKASNRPEENSFEMQKTESMAKAESVNDDGIKRLQVFSDEELSKLDRKKISSGQIGKMVTLGCFAHCRVDADIAPIEVGDLLTTSPLKGHAQKVLEPEKAVGAIIGKALGSLKKGKGKIPVLVMMQ